MDYKASKRNWKSKQQQSNYTSSTGPKEEKKSGREEFKKDLAEAIQKGTKKVKKKKPATYATKGKGKKDGLNSWSVAELRKLLNQKKHNLLMKAGFPDGKLPRSKVGMIALCKKLKRKRW
jgi:hypothetical protein